MVERPTLPQYHMKMVSPLYKKSKKEFCVDEMFEKEQVGEGTYGVVYRAKKKDP